MILSFSDRFPWGGPTNFQDKIDRGYKVHTFRIGDRWRPDMPIHFWMGNPRNPKRAFPFFPTAAYIWEPYKEGDKLPVVIATEQWEMEFTDLPQSCMEFEFRLSVGRWDVNAIFGIGPNGKYKIIDRDIGLREVASNDGLKEDEFLRWFHLAAMKHKTNQLTGQVIHWFGTCKGYDYGQMKLSKHFLPQRNYKKIST